MKIKDIPKSLGITARDFAEMMGILPQVWNDYANGRRNKRSAVITQAVAVANCCIEEVVFPDHFQHPDGENPDQPAYWINIALEALREAEKRGLPVDLVGDVESVLVGEVKRGLEEFSPED